MIPKMFQAKPKNAASQNHLGTADFELVVLMFLISLSKSLGIIAMTQQADV
jgi:hypothetical protein